MAVQAGFSRIAAALADPAREAMLVALIDGRALPAGELAGISGVSPSSATAHLHRLLDEGLLSVWPQGRCRYYRLANEEVAGIIESLSTLAARPRRGKTPQSRIPPATRFARHCYGHLAGQLGVALTDRLRDRGYVEIARDAAALTPAGMQWLADAGIATNLPQSRRNLRPCLDWTERRFHLAGGIPAAILRFLLERDCLRRVEAERTLLVTPPGRRWFAQLGIDPKDVREHSGERAAATETGDGRIKPSAGPHA